MNKSSFDSCSWTINYDILEHDLALSFDIYDTSLLSEIVDKIGLLKRYLAILAIKDSALDCTISLEYWSCVCHLRIL